LQFTSTRTARCLDCHSVEDRRNVAGKITRTFTTDLKDRKIRVNAVSPGVIPSPGYRNSAGMTEEQIKQYVDSVVVNIPLGRTGTLDEVAKVVSFLPSDEKLRHWHRALRRRRHDPNLTSLTAGVSTRSPRHTR